MKDLNKVLSKLKSGKSQDANGLINEIFQSNNIGESLKNSLLLLLNKTKKQLKTPNFMEDTNITSIYKGKGKMSDLENDRGIFSIAVPKMIRDKLVYNDIYDIADASMSESQVGARKARSIRNHVWVIYQIINEVLKNKSEPIDIQIYNVAKCLDSLYLKKCCNDLYEAGITDDKLAVIFEGSQEINVAINTPAGQTKRIPMHENVQQGEALSSLICAIQIDKIGENALETGKYLYKYRKDTNIVPLSMMGIDRN